MLHTSVIFASDRGNTEALASSMHKALTDRPDTQVELVHAGNATANSILEADLLLIGSPVHMGSMHWQLKRFIDEQCGPLWKRKILDKKLFGVFSTGGGFGAAGGGVDTAQIGLISNFIQLGMTFAPLTVDTDGFARGGSHWGPHGQTNDAVGNRIPPNEDVLQCAHRHALRLATLAEALRDAQP